MKNYLYSLTLLFLLPFISSCDNKTSHTEGFETKMINYFNSTPIINVAINNDDCKLIVDTGSEINILDKDFFIKHVNDFELIDSSYINLNTLSGCSSQMTYLVKTKINDSIPVYFNVIDINETKENIFVNQMILIDGILGVDFLYKNKLVIDFKNKIITNIY